MTLLGEFKMAPWMSYILASASKNQNNGKQREGWSRLRKQ